ncbi:unnamed protein product [Callosobruchus maculatus]|uniref:Uncharacterized protein n=1 Tax=Callosobruchus maculatus TaxID=64391 RepID=A0A653CQ70_CALMS|nr:unnamed protein product [Callosobruchus maculatus]
MYFAFVCVLVAFTVSATDALSCYNCQVCEEPFVASEASRTTCSGSDQVCLKLNIRTSDGSSVTGRQCSSRTQNGQNICDFLRSSGTSLGSVTSCSPCTSDLCNA